MQQHPLVDFSYLEELSGEDPGYIATVLEIFLDTTPPGIYELDRLIKKTSDWDAIYKQAHFLKSGVTIVKIAGMFDQFAEIEQLGRRKEDRPRIEQLMANVLDTLEKVLPSLIEEKDIHRAQAPKPIEPEA